MSLRILSVFDSVKATAWVASQLAEHQLVQVGTIMAAMQVLQKEKIDVTLVQLHLQNESLFDLLRSIRRNDYYREMSFICCDTSDTSRKDHRPLVQVEFVEKSCLLYGATKVIASENFYSENLESENPRDAGQTWLLKWDVMNNILAVEDDLTQRYVLRIVLESFGMNFEIVSSAEEALLDLFAPTKNYAVILMDIRLPGMDGFECTREIRKREEKAGARRMAIIAVTAFASLEDRQLCLDAGMDDYISKPYTVEALRALIDKYLEPPRGYDEPNQNDKIQSESQAHQ